MPYIVDDAELTASADAIRDKTGGTDPITWESGGGFANAIAGISGYAMRTVTGEHLSDIDPAAFVAANADMVPQTGGSTNTMAMYIHMTVPGFGTGYFALSGFASSGALQTLGGKGKIFVSTVEVSWDSDSGWAASYTNFSGTTDVTETATNITLGCFVPM